MGLGLGLGFGVRVKFREGLQRPVREDVHVHIAQVRVYLQGQVRVRVRVRLRVRVRARASVRDRVRVRDRDRVSPKTWPTSARNWLSSTPLRWCAKVWNWRAKPCSRRAYCRSDAATRSSLLRSTPLRSRQLASLHCSSCSFWLSLNMVQKLKAESLIEEESFILVARSLTLFFHASSFLSSC